MAKGNYSLSLSLLICKLGLGMASTSSSEGTELSASLHMLQLLAPSPRLQRVVTMSTVSGAVDQPAPYLALSSL